MTNNIFQGIDTDSLKEEDLDLIKKQLKEIEKKVKENNKPKTITVSSKSHNQIKKYCQIFNLTIGEWAEKTLLKEIELQNCFEIDDLSYEERRKSDIEDITKKWIKENYGNHFLVKFSKPLMSKYLRYKGWSVADGFSIYEYIGNDFVHFLSESQLQSLGLTYRKVDRSEISTVHREEEIDPIILNIDSDLFDLKRISQKDIDKMSVENLFKF